MENAVCPHCQEALITSKQRLLGTLWMDMYCSGCGGRSSLNHIGLALIYMTWVWNVAFFGFMAVAEESLVYLAVMLVGWGILQFFAFYLPLLRLRRKQPNTSAQ
ncbi:MAG: hypothetical protein OEW58_00235 [Gammaproteobacteria bacterium]|nr:hypothetical protein [Gammaproteobacteria bacterium]